MLSRLESVGSYVPEAVLTTEELLGRMPVPASVDLEKVSGVGRRHVYDARPEHYEDSFVLASRAAFDALRRSRYEAKDLDIVISCSITRTVGAERFVFEPSFALGLKNSIGAPLALHFDISNACAGMFTGAMILDRMIRAGMVRRRLVVSGEQITLISETAVREISNKYDPQFASLTVGDAGAAVILEAASDKGDAVEYIDIMTCAEYSDLCIGMPSDRSEGVSLYTDNRSMHNESRYKLWTTRQRDFLESRNSDFMSERYDFIIHHQFSGPAIDYIHQIAEREFEAKMPEELRILEDFGNTASTSHFVVLHEYLKRGKVPAGSRILMVPAASGVVTGYLSLTVGPLAA